MGISLAFETVQLDADPPLASRPAHAIAAAARVRQRIWRELAADGTDVLWRLTTRPWARGRSAVARPAPHALAHVVEGAVELISMVAMTFLSLACLVA